MAMRTRKDVWKLADWDPVLLWYAKGILRMQARPIEDPTSWRYQAAIHDYIRAGDPHAKPEDHLPSPADQKKFWIQCQHNSWYFLPWHRMYLHCFEQIVAAAVVDAGGPRDWALPYWNYSDPSNPNARKLPPAFRATKLPDGTPNPLRVEARNPGANDGDEVAGDREVDIRTCLSEPSYTAAARGGNPGFGGPQTQFSHSGRVFGKLEATPHGSMHVAVGGWMGSFNTAGLDPIFWVHHCNIDRLWSVWRLRDDHDLNPTQAQWLTSLPFDFHDAGGQVVTLTPGQVVDTTVAPLSYQYEDVSDPLRPSTKPQTESARGLTVSERIPEMVGATDRAVTLGEEPTDATLAISQPVGPGAREMAESGAAQPEIYLNLENITGSGQPENYEVYLNLPANSKPEDHPELFAGILPTFGVQESSRTDAEHAGGGLNHALEVSGIVRTLQASNDWDPNNVKVTFVPLHRRTAGAREMGQAPIRIGRVSLYHS